MAKLNGIPVENIIKVNAILATSIQSISGIPTANISGWPGTSPSCESTSFRFGPTPGAACGGSSAFYDFDPINNLLYESGQCGITQAAPGFYVNDTTNERFRWFFDGENWQWEPSGICI